MKVYTTDKISLGGHSLDVAWVEGLSSTNVNLGVTAHGWGNHADAGYLTSYNDTNTWRGIHDTPVDGETAVSISSNWAFDNVKTAVPAGALFTDTDTTYVSSDFTHNDLTGYDSNVHRDWALDQGSTNIHIGNYTQRPISSTPTDGQADVAISSDWAFDNVKTAVPAGALFTDTNTTYDLSGYLLNTTDSWSGTHTTSGLLKFTGTGAGQGIQFNSTTVANDAFGIRVNGTSNAGELEFFSTDDDNEAFVWRHYTTGQGGTGASVEWFRIGAGGNVSANGTVTGSNLSGTNTGDQDLSGYLTTSGKAADSELLDGLNSTAYMRDDGWNTNPGQDADTQTGMRSDFSYGNNAPNVGELLRFGAGNYSTQFSSQYAGVGKGLNFRTRNGDAASWNPWYGIWHTGNLTNNNQLTNGSNYVSYISTDQIGASLFYDINNTNYFLHLDATSRLNILQTVSTSVNKNSSQTTKDGLSLYGAHAGGEPTYGMMFTGTADSGTHGAVTSDWATYFTMNNSSSRGWIFRRVGSGNSASISAGGAATFDTSVTSNKFYDTNNTNSWLDIRDSSGNYHLKANEGGMYFDAPVYYIRDLSNNAQKITIDAGTATATGSLRAPIFYDSNDTSYFTNPASTSNLNSIRLASHLSVGGHSDGGASNLSTSGRITFGSLSTDALGNYSIGTTLENYGGNYNKLDLAFHTGIRLGAHPNYGGVRFYTDQTMTTEILAVGKSGAHVQAANSLRAPIFYDSNNTGYYTNPASTSNLNQLQVTGMTNGWSAQLGPSSISRVYNDSARASLVINSVNYPHLYINATGGTSNSNHGGVISMTGNTTSGYRRWSMGWPNYNPTVFSMGSYDDDTNPHYGCGGTLGVSTWGSRYWFDTSGNGQAHSSWRAPIFYDSNNTGYYTNPASTSNLNQIDTVTTNATTVNATQYQVNAGDGNGLKFWSSDSYKISMGNSSIYHYGPVPGYSIKTQMDSGSTDRGFSWGRVGVVPIAALNSTSGNFQTAGTMTASNMYAFAFYDSNNTAYVVNPASTSTFANINAANFYGTLTGNASTVSNGMYVNTAQSVTGTKTFNSNRNTTSSSPPLQAYGTTSGAIMAFHRGGHYAVNFGLDSDNVMRIGGWSAAANRWQLDMSGHNTVAGSSRAPIFYDSNNTGYYVNPASTSNLNVLTLAGTATASNFILSSDERKKTKIKDLTRNNINTNWKSFEMKNDEGEYRTGVIAQELEETHPEFVNTDSEGFKSVKYIDLLIAKIAELEARLEKAGI